jgi:hypothetical protein
MKCSGSLLAEIYAWFGCFAWREGISGTSSLFHTPLEIITMFLVCCNKLVYQSWDPSWFKKHSCEIYLNEFCSCRCFCVLLWWRGFDAEFSCSSMWEEMLVILGFCGAWGDTWTRWWLYMMEGLRSLWDDTGWLSVVNKCFLGICGPSFWSSFRLSKWCYFGRCNVSLNRVSAMVVRCSG